MNHLSKMNIIKCGINVVYLKCKNQTLIPVCVGEFVTVCFNLMKCFLIWMYLWTNINRTRHQVGTISGAAKKPLHHFSLHDAREHTSWSATVLQHQADISFWMDRLCRMGSKPQSTESVQLSFAFYMQAPLFILLCANEYNTEHV